MRHRSLVVAHFAAVVVAVPSACSRGGDARSDAATTPAGSTAASRPGAVTTAKWPATGCDWVPVAEVEAILGPLAGPPVAHEQTSCRYPLPLDSAAAKSRAAYRAFLGPNAPGLRGVDLDKVVVVLTVDVRGDLSNERAGRVVGTMFGAMMASALGGARMAGDSATRRDESAPGGWDVASALARNRDFSGRIGHVAIRVEENVSVEQAVPAAKKAALAALVRDRIPDLPFRLPQIDDMGPVPPPSGPDPCGLLTRGEAEAVLGRLVVPPYRSNDGNAYADERGPSCAYFTAGHHVFVVYPHWSEGKQQMELVRGTGNLVGGLTGDQEGAAADTLEGPWEEAVLGLDGTLSFLAGDRVLEVAFATSSADQAGTLELARIAVKRLAATAINRP